MTRKRYESQDDYNRSMIEIIKEVKNKDILIPPHQRDGNIWNWSRKIGWVNRLDSHIRPIGVISTYEARDNKGKVWLNDGNQRVHATIDFLARPKSYGYDEKIAIEIVTQYRMPVQFRIYDDHREAYEDFKRLNFNEGLTAYEFYKGTLLYMKNYSEVYKPILDSLSRAITESRVRITGKRSKARSTLHTQLRHNYLILYRFLHNEYGLTSISVGKTDITGRSLDNNDIIEKKLRSLLESMSHGNIKREVDKLIGLIDRETSLIEHEWGKVVKRLKLDRGKPITPSLYHYLIELATWRYRQKIPVSIWRQFIYDLLSNTKGTTSVVNPKDINHKKTISYGALDRIPSVCNLIGSNMLDYPYERSKRDPQIKDGYDHSHKNPHATHGEGETFIEPASLNRARGSKPVEDHA